MFTPKTKRAVARALRYVMEESPTYINAETLTSSAAASALFKLHLCGKKREHFAVAFLTSQHTLIKFEILFSGTIDAASVYPRIVASKALEYNAAAVIVGHNHPSGITESSMADRQITSELGKALNLLNIRLLDHIIVAGTSTTSMRANGEID